jgi:hypothetical protein
MLGQLGQGRAQFQQTVLGEGAHGHPEIRHGFAGEPVEHVLALAPGLHQVGLAQLLEVGAGQLHGDFRLRRQPLHGLLALAQEFDQLQPLGAAHRLADAGDLGIERILDLPSGVFHPILQSSLEC